jgi:hypothetical protein
MPYLARLFTFIRRSLSLPLCPSAARLTAWRREKTARPNRRPRQLPRKGTTAVRVLIRRRAAQALTRRSRRPKKEASSAKAKVPCAFAFARAACQRGRGCKIVLDRRGIFARRGGLQVPNTPLGIRPVEVAWPGAAVLHPKNPLGGRRSYDTAAISAKAKKIAIFARPAAQLSSCGRDCDDGRHSF